MKFIIDIKDEETSKLIKKYFESQPKGLRLQYIISVLSSIAYRANIDPISPMPFNVNNVFNITINDSKTSLKEESSDESISIFTNSSGEIKIDESNNEKIQEEENNQNGLLKSLLKPL